MSPSRRTGDALSRFLPLAVAVLIIVAGYVWFVQPRVTAYLRSRTEVETLETRVRVLQDTVARGRGILPPDEAAAMRLFEERTSKDDKVSEVVEILAKTAQEVAPADRMRGLQIQTGTAVRWQPGQPVVHTGAGDEEDGGDPDPRFALFETPLIYTPVTISFESSYDGITRFLWRMRDLPTTIELRSMELTRALPLMQAKIRIFVFQRGEAAAVPSPQAPAPGGTASPTAPRVAALSTGEGW